MADYRESGYADFPGIYLLNHSVGRPPLRVMAAANNDFFVPWIDACGDVWPAWFEAIDKFRRAVARLLGTEFRLICPQANLSSALAKVVYSTPLDTERNVLLCHGADFPSMGFVLGQAEKEGFELRVIPADADPQDPETWRHYIDARVRLGLVTHVHSNTSQLLPVAAICRLLRERGAFSVVDIAQSVGVVPISVSEWGCDIVLGSCVKWLCGGPGAGFMWVSEGCLDTLEPRDVGWFSHADPFEFKLDDFRYHDSALKFWGGTPSILPFSVASAAIEHALERGIDVIREHNQALVDIMVNALSAESIGSPRIAAERGGTAVVNPVAGHHVVAERLSAAGVAYDQRSTGFRLSPHIYNTADEIGLVLAALTPTIR